MRKIASTREVNGTRSVPTPLLPFAIFLWLVAASQACLAGEAVTLQIDRLMVPLSVVDRFPAGDKQKSSHSNEFRVQAVDVRVELDHPFNFQFRFRNLAIDVSGSVARSKSTRNAFDVQIRYESWTENSVSGEGGERVRLEQREIVRMNKEIELGGIVRGESQASLMEIPRLTLKPAVDVDQTKIAAEAVQKVVSTRHYRARFKTQVHSDYQGDRLPPGPWEELCSCDLQTSTATPFHVCLRFDRMSITADGVLGAESKPGKVDHQLRFNKIFQSTSSLPLDDSQELPNHSSTTASGGGNYTLGKDVRIMTGSTGRVAKQKDGTDLLLNTTFKAFVRIDRIPSK